ncbi:hypothetical protein ACPOL_3135 [Acidisarcina polymorpha]|uniref:Uncharacterized protein n=1 Tax=Acidisarcina polymorpha TaxID=2211140 RepID=A0A2Z5G0A5_9BACT|nr:hypothetical protein ACPOL_3135 [Acidisarcina polymorpha]
MHQIAVHADRLCTSGPNKNKSPQFFSQTGERMGLALGQEANATGMYIESLLRRVEAN